VKCRFVLDDIIVGAVFDRVGRYLDAVLAGEKDDGKIGIARLQFGEHLNAVHRVRLDGIELIIEHDKIRLARDPGQRVLARIEHGNARAGYFFLDRIADHLAHRGIVIDDHDRKIPFLAHPKRRKRGKIAFPGYP